MNDNVLSFIPPVGHPSLHGMIFAVLISIAFCGVAFIIDKKG